MENRRYYRAIIQRDLLGEWTLVRSWGSLDSNRGQMRTELINTYDQCISIMGDIAKKRELTGDTIQSTHRSGDTSKTEMCRELIKQTIFINNHGFYNYGQKL
jgi:hypothetical protein